MNQNTNYLLTLCPYFARVHHVPGRIRLRVDPKIKQKISNLDTDQIKSQISAINGIKAIKFNQIVGSLTIEYDAALLPNTLWDELLSGSPSQICASYLNQIKGASC